MNEHLKWEDVFVQWCAEHVAKGYLQEYPEDAAGATLEDLRQQALDDPLFVAHARAKFRFETANDLKPH